MPKAETIKRNLVEYLKLYLTITPHLEYNLQRMSLKSLEELGKEVKSKLEAIKTSNTINKVKEPEPEINYHGGRGGNIEWIRWYRRNNTSDYSAS